MPHLLETVDDGDMGMMRPDDGITENEEGAGTCAVHIVIEP
jgi:hypothetical protein